MSAAFEEVVDPVDGTRWRVDTGFLRSNWTCIWDRGCEGILSEPSPQRQQGCCSVGAELIDDDEALRIGGLGLSLDPARFQHAAVAEQAGVFADGTNGSTRIVDGACIFLNRPGFAGGEGCALHLAALDDGESPIEYKPTICWQMPFAVDAEADGTRTLRVRERGDWGDEPMAWWCTEPQPADGLASAFVGEEPVAAALHTELRGIVGPEVAVELRRRYG